MSQVAYNRRSLFRESVSRSVMSDSATPRTLAHQAPLFLEFSRQQLEWVAIPLSRGSSRPRDRIQVPLIAGGFLAV